MMLTTDDDDVVRCFIEATFKNDKGPLAYIQALTLSLSPPRHFKGAPGVSATSLSSIPGDYELTNLHDHSSLHPRAELATSTQLVE